MTRNQENTLILLQSNHRSQVTATADEYSDAVIVEFEDDGVTRVGYVETDGSCNWLN